MEKIEKSRRTFALILFLTLVVCTVYSLVKFILAPDEIPENGVPDKLKSDYLLMLVQCCLGIFVMTIPGIISRRFRLMIPGVMCILYYIFLYCAIILGEILSFYHLFPGVWDSLLHAMSAAMLATLGFILVDWLNKEEGVRFSINPFFVALFAFSFAVMVGTLWEIYEFCVDGALKLNMQHYAAPDATPYLGRAAVIDTMKDIIIDVIASLVVALIGLATYLKRKRTVDRETLEPSAGAEEQEKAPTAIGVRDQ